MEIAVISSQSVKIKGKQASVVVGSQEKGTYNALLCFDFPEASLPDDQIVITGVGEYEIGGIKITGIRSETGMIYAVTVDSIVVLVGRLSSLHKMQSKLPDAQIVVVSCDVPESASFVTSLASNVIVFYGKTAEGLVQTIGKENIKTVNRVSFANKEKLPQEMETVLLQ